MKRMLINATQAEELRVALVDGQRLYDLDIEQPSNIQKKANIYKGRITRIEQSLEAVFVDYGADRNGFLPLKEISRSYFKNGGKGSGNGRPNISELLEEGQEILVQVQKDERGNKGAALSTFISLAGRFLVLMPNNPRAGGISRRIEGDDRNQIRDAMRDLESPKGMGVIARTAGIGRTTEEIQWDLDFLVRLWEEIEGAVASKPAPFLVYEESNLVIRALRDYLDTDIGEIHIDAQDAYDQAHAFVEKVMPSSLRKLKRYEDPVPLFTRYQIESQIETAFKREVRLPSGGSIVIDQTEALTAIDINSARATKGADIEETATHTNLEAADEIGRQLRLRDLGGLVVIDFIDMSASRNQRSVETRLRDAVKADRARVQMGKISRFGLVEMSRQRLKPSLGESSYKVCPRCSGHGFIRGVRSLALSVLRLIQEEAMKEYTVKVAANVPVDVSTFLLNEKRDDIRDIEQRYGISVLIITNPDIQTPHFAVHRLKQAEVEEFEAAGPSYKLVSLMESVEEDDDDRAPETVTREQPAVSGVTPTSPVPQAPNVSFIAKVWAWIIGLFAGGDDKKKGSKPAKGKGKSQQRDNQRGRGQQQQGRGRQQGGRGQGQGGRGQGGQGQGGRGRNQRGQGQGRQQQGQGRGRNQRGRNNNDELVDNRSDARDSSDSSKGRERNERNDRNDRNERNDGGNGNNRGGRGRGRGQDEGRGQGRGRGQDESRGRGQDREQGSEQNNEGGRRQGGRGRQGQQGQGRERGERREREPRPEQALGDTSREGRARRPRRNLENLAEGGESKAPAKTEGNVADKPVEKPTQADKGQSGEAQGERRQDNRGNNNQGERGQEGNNRDGNNQGQRRGGNQRRRRPQGEREQGRGQDGRGQDGRGQQGQQGQRDQAQNDQRGNERAEPQAKAEAKTEATPKPERKAKPEAEAKPERKPEPKLESKPRESATSDEAVKPKAERKPAVEKADKPAEASKGGRRNFPRKPSGEGVEREAPKAAASAPAKERPPAAPAADAASRRQFPRKPTSE